MHQDCLLRLSFEVLWDHDDMRRLDIRALSLSLSLLILLPIAVAEASGGLKLVITKEHGYLNGYKPAERAFIGDEWNLRLKVTDEDGDPAAGAVARIYRGSKTLASGRINSKGITRLSLPITKLGKNSLRIVVIDDDPKNKGEAVFTFNAVNPDTIVNPVEEVIAKNFYQRPSELEAQVLALNVPQLREAGCIRYWMIYPDYEATWPFADSEITSLTGNMNIPSGDQAKLDSILLPNYKGWRAIPDQLQSLICIKSNGNLAVFLNQ
jgi:hypothetical protein